MSFCPGGTISKSTGMGGWKIRTAKTSHDFRRGSFFRDAPFAPWFLPSLSSSLPSHFRPCKRAHIPHEREGASCGRHTGGSGTAKRVDKTRFVTHLVGPLTLCLPLSYSTPLPNPNPLTSAHSPQSGEGARGACVCSFAPVRSRLLRS